MDAEYQSSDEQDELGIDEHDTDRLLLQVQVEYQVQLHDTYYSSDEQDELRIDEHDTGLVAAS